MWIPFAKWASWVGKKHTLTQFYRRIPIYPSFIRGLSTFDDTCVPQPQWPKLREHPRLEIETTQPPAAFWRSLLMFFPISLPKKNNFLKKNKVYHEFGFISPGSGFTPFLLLNFRKLMSFLHPLHWVSRTDGPHDTQMIGPSLSLCD